MRDREGKGRNGGKRVTGETRGCFRNLGERFRSSCLSEMQFREIVKPLDRSNRRNNVDGEGEREEDQRKSKFIHWTIGKFSEWSMSRPRESLRVSPWQSF